MCASGKMWSLVCRPLWPLVVREKRLKLELFFGDRVKYLEQTVHDSFVKNSSKAVLLAQMVFVELDCDTGKNKIYKSYWDKHERDNCTQTNVRQKLQYIFDHNFLSCFLGVLHFFKNHPFVHSLLLVSVFLLVLVKWKNHLKNRAIWFWLILVYNSL